MNLRFAALSVAGSLALGACADPSSPEPASAPDFSDLSQISASASRSSGQLQRLASARTNPADLGRFEVAFKFLVPPTDAQRAVFQTAADRWQRIIINDVPSVSGTLPSCFSGLPPVSTDIIDDVVIEVALVPIDGPGKILGAAGPCWVRDEDNLPVSGVMYFDSADLAYLESLGLFDEVIVHEMGHVLGIGTLWNFGRSLVQGTASQPYFGGQLANTHWVAEGGLGYLPIENSGGAGTIYAHWRESALRNELMTGYLNLGENPLSRITGGSLADMGYGVGVVGESYALQKGTEGVTPTTTETISSKGVNIERGESMLDPVGIVPKGY